MGSDPFTHDVLGEVNTESMWCKIFPARVFFPGLGSLVVGGYLALNGVIVIGIPVIILTVIMAFMFIMKTSESDYRKAGGISMVSYIKRMIRMKRITYIYALGAKKGDGRK